MKFKVRKELNTATDEDIYKVINTYEEDQVYATFHTPEYPNPESSANILCEILNGEILEPHESEWFKSEV